MRESNNLVVSHYFDFLRCNVIVKGNNLFEVGHQQQTNSTLCILCFITTVKLSNHLKQDLIIANVNVQ